MASNAKKKLDEKHLKLLRDIASLVHNRECFDCHQRGPTYVNMTVGSFICTSCSGLLRGLNPPHRVKSISMSSFTPEEIEFIVCRGNEFCRRTWTGLHDGRSHAELSSKDEGKMRDFFIQKYEKKRWYVAPTEAMLEEARKLNQPEQADVKPLKSLNAGVAALTLHNGQSKTPKPLAPIDGSSVSRPTSSQIKPTPELPRASSPPRQQPTQNFDFLTSTTAPVAPKPTKPVDLLADFGSDPFSSPSTAASIPQAATGFGFGADFSQFSQQPQASSAFSSNNANNVLQPQTKAPVNTHAPVSPPKQVAHTDKYSALADLDGLFGGSAASGASSTLGGNGLFGAGTASGASSLGASTGAGLFGGGSVQPTWAAGQPTNATNWMSGAQATNGGWQGGAMQWGGASQPVDTLWGGASGGGTQQWGSMQYAQTMAAPGGGAPVGQYAQPVSMNPFVYSAPTAPTGGVVAMPANQFYGGGVANNFAQPNTQPPAYGAPAWGAGGQPAAFPSTWGAMQSTPAAAGQGARQSAVPQKSTSTNPFL